MLIRVKSRLDHFPLGREHCDASLCSVPAGDAVG